MRLFTINLIALVALAFTATTASAYLITLENLSGPVAGATDSLTVDVVLDTQGESNIKLFEIGVKFNTAYLEYQPGSSTIGGNPYPGYPNYILYSSPVTGRGGRPASQMEPRVPVPGGFSYDPPILILPGQVNTGWVETNLAATFATGTNIRLATLSFHATAAVPKDATLALTLTEGGTVFQLGDNTIISGQVSLGPELNIAPEPGIIAVSFAALLTLGGLRRYGRRKS